MNEQKWYSTVEVAAMLGRSDRFVRDRVKSGELPARAHANAKRSSYKISREALLEFMLGQERKGVKEVAEILKGADEYYLRELEEIIMAEIARRRGGRVEVVPLRMENKLLIYELEKRNLSHDVLIELGPDYDRFFKNPMHLCATAIDRTARTAEGHLSVAVTTADFYEGILAGKETDEVQPPWRPGETPVLYVDCLILEDPVWAPFLFRSMARQIRELGRREGIAPKACFAISSSPESLKLLKKYGFEEKGKTKEGHPIMLNRDITRGRLGAYLR